MPLATCLHHPHGAQQHAGYTENEDSTGVAEEKVVGARDRAEEAPARVPEEPGPHAAEQATGDRTLWQRATGRSLRVRLYSKGKLIEEVLYESDAKQSRGVSAETEGR